LIKCLTVFDKFFIHYRAKERVVKLRLLSSRYGITKIIVALLIVVFALAAVAISCYAATTLFSQNSSPTPTPPPEPTVSPTPISSFQITPTPITTPTPLISAIPTPFPTEITPQEKIRDSAMNFIKSNHPETALFMKDLVWTGGTVTLANIVGAETYMYYSNGWNVTINYPVVPDTIYSIVTDYSAPSLGIPYRIIWVGTSQNEVIKETSFVFAQ
jgi:hypothetical protein